MSNYYSSEWRLNTTPNLDKNYNIETYIPHNPKKIHIDDIFVNPKDYYKYDGVDYNLHKDDPRYDEEGNVKLL